jgi:hypothetical protein
VLIAAVQWGFEAHAQDHGRIKKKPPTPAEAERIVSDMVMSDSSLQPGDVVSTNRGFFLFRGMAADGISGDFVQIPNPFNRKN